MRYKILSPVNFDNTRYEVGEEIELSAADAHQLLEANAIEPFVKPFGRQVTSPVGGSGASGA